MTKPPHFFYEPLAAGAPSPMRERPAQLERMIHFLPPHIEKMRDRVPGMLEKVDVLLGNLEDAIPADAKEAARAGFVEVMKANDFSQTGCWTRVNALNSPWMLDDISTLILEAGDKLDVIMVPKVEGPWDIHFVDQYVASLEAKAGLTKPIQLHAILETAQGVANVEAICGASPRMQGISLGPADLAASRGMKTTRVGGGHPGYRVIGDPSEGAARESVQQDLWHYTVARMVDACVTYGLKAFYGPFGAIDDPEACEQQFRNAFLLGCSGAWSLHPSQIDIAKKVFSPDPDEVKLAIRILECLPDGTGVAMLDGKMQDDASWKQAKVIVDLAKQVAAKDPELADAYGL